MDSDNGRCAILLPHGVLNRLTEKDIRKNLIDADLVEAVISIGKNLFFNSPMEACILLCRTNKPEERKNKILLIKATDLVERKNTESYLTEDHIRIISDIFLNYKIVEGRSTIIDICDIPIDKYSISPKLYVKSNDNVDTEDFSELLSKWSVASSECNKELMSFTKLLGNGNS